MRTLAMLLLLTVSATAVAAEKDKVYKWTDENGVIHYSSKPPSDAATPAQLPPLQTYKEGTNPDLKKFDKGQQQGGKKGASGIQVQVVTPSADETFRGAERTVPVAVMVTPALTDGQKLIYLLDGTPDAAPTTDTSHAFQNVDRGSHTVSVTLIDEAGTEVGRSGAVTFHVKPPTAKR